MSFLDKTGLQTLTNKLVQGDAIKVASHRGHTVANVIDNIQRECDNVANPLEYKIENRIAEFKIGKGRDVDVSGDVENGYTEVELQGKTYQNLINDNKWLHSETKITSSHTNNASLVATSFLRNKNLMKPSTTYTLILDLNIVLNTLKNSYFQLNCERVDGKQESVVRITNVSYLRSGGLMRVKFTTSDTFFRLAQAFIGGYGGTLTIKSNGMTILEGDHTQTPAEELPQYFDGIKSSFEDGIVDVEVQGKNLLNIKHKTLEVQGLIIEANEEKQQFIVNGSATGDAYVYFCGETWKSELNDSITNTNYSLTILTDGDVDVKSDRKDLLHVQMGYKDENNVSKSYFDKRVTQLGEVKCGLFRTGDYRITSPWFRLDKGNVYKNFVIKLQIQHQANTSYEPCYKKKISFNIDEPLRSLPNGVCDEIRNNNGQWELVRRVNKVVLDGSENWNNNTGWETDNTMALWTILHSITNLNSSPWVECISNNFVNYGEKINTVDCNGIRVNQRGTTMDYILYIRIEKSRLSTHDIAGFKQWLAKNPTTVYYKLDTPIITPIEPIEFEIKPLGSININSDISPISYHIVQLNRAGQIERAICDIAELKNRVEALEIIYDTTFLETQHKLSLLEMDYELEGGSV